MFQLFDPGGEGLNGRFYSIFPSYQPGGKGLDDQLCLIFATFRLFDLGYFLFFEFPNFRPGGGRPKWSMLLTFFDFSTFRPGREGLNG